MSKAETISTTAYLVSGCRRSLLDLLISDRNSESSSEEEAVKSNALSAYRLTPSKLEHLGRPTPIEAEEVRIAPFMYQTVGEWLLEFGEEQESLGPVSPQSPEQDTVQPLENTASVSDDTKPEAGGVESATDHSLDQAPSQAPSQAQGPLGFSMLPREVRNLI